LHLQSKIPHFFQVVEILVGVAKKPLERRMGVVKKLHEEHLRLQLYYSTVNDVRSNTVYFIGESRKNV
jgi:hypothetical protein